MLRTLISSLLKNLLVRPLRLAARVFWTSDPDDITLHYDPETNIITTTDNTGRTTRWRAICFGNRELRKFNQ